jgi:hypothetical protein
MTFKIRIARATTPVTVAAWKDSCHHSPERRRPGRFTS